MRLKCRSEKSPLVANGLLFASRRDSPNSSQAGRCQTAFAWLAKECRSVAVSQAENLCSAMDARISVIVDSAQIGNHDASELTMLHWRTGFVYDLDEDVPLRDVEIALVNGTGSCEQAKLGGTVEVTDRGDAVCPRSVDGFRAKGPA